MQAIILAAGMGKRLKELTKNNTKCMVEVNGVTLIERMLRQLDSLGLARIIIVTGYKSAELLKHIESLHITTQLCFVDNPVYDKTNNIYSLYLVKDQLMSDDTLVFESDIIFEDSVLECLIKDKSASLALVDKYEPWMDGTCLRLDDDDNVVGFVSGRKFDFNNTAGLYKTVNIYKFDRNFSKQYYVPFLEAYKTAFGSNQYYEQVLQVITLLDEVEIKAKRLDHQRWYEIDDVQDLDIAEALFCEDVEEKVIRMEERYGGYWRFPGLLDYCYLVNPYYPPQKMKDELRASFDRLLVEYPSGMRVNSVLAGKNFDVRSENIVVGNGAAELIKSLMNQLSGRIGFIRPTFEEYPNRYERDNSVYYVIDNCNYSYNSADIEAFFGDKDVSAIVLINPDNPSGNYIQKKELISLIEWCGSKGIRLIVDESFADFSDETDNSLIKQDLLDTYEMLYVVKSISKSYGIPGLRLGVLASGDTEMIGIIKKDVAIWNINSFGEFYMQIAEKYKAQYERALIDFRNERKRFLGELKTIDSIRVIPSQANYFMIELLNDLSVKEVTKALLSGYNILVKDLYEKMGGKQYMRIAVRDTRDNKAFIKALKSVITAGKDL